MSDAFLTLAKVDSQDALSSCFLVPRWLPDGSRNSGFHLVRMKRKMADFANASSEVEYHDCLGYPVGEEGKGVKTILQMVQLTRLTAALVPQEVCDALCRWPSTTPTLDLPLACHSSSSP
jgi:putative acyl-CoA dehydrogenase